MKIKTAIFVIMLSVGFFAVEVNADTRLVNTRTGIHESYTRMVIDSEGDYPISIKHDSGNTVDISYTNLLLTEEERSKLRQQIDEVADLMIYRDKNISHFNLFLRSKNVRLKTFYLPPKNNGDSGYRLVIDIYPPRAVSGAEEQKSAPQPVPVNKEVKTNSFIIKKEENPHSLVSDTKENTEKESSGFEEKNGAVSMAKKNESGAQSVPDKNDAELNKQTEAKKEKSPLIKSPDKRKISGKAEIILKNTSGEKDSSKFDEYSDKAKAVSGNLEINLIKENSSEVRFEMNDVGREDQNARLNGDFYGTAKIKAGYTELPHRYQYGARTLYSGVGTGNLTLDNTIQSNLASTQFADVDNRLSAYFNSAISGNPTVTRKKGYLNIEWTRFDPFRFNLVLKKEKRNGTIPRFGALGVGNTVELLEPVDYDATQVRINGEFNKGSIYLSTSYYISAFDNDIKSLSWDSPLALNDSLFDPSRGLMSLPPDNSYHNLSMSGSIRNLPYYTRITASAAFGWMRQDDSLLPYTINSAVDAPSVPVGNIDGEVRTRLLNLMITSNPHNLLDLKIKFNSYEHKNNTTPISFPGYVDTDAYFISTPVINLPSSYEKNTLDAGIRKDLFRNTRLGLNYTRKNMKRDNREVSEQNDQGFKVFLDTTTIAWLYLRTSYERVKRNTENYVFDSYLASGEDLYQNPLLRKYDEADMIRDRIQFHAAITPWDKLGLSLSYIYGQDNFDKSTYGLLDDQHHIFSFDADYSFSENTSLHAFYSYERYRNLTSGNDYSGDWTVAGEDRVNSIGGNLRAKLFSDNLNLDISYSYSKADGDLGFALNGAGYSRFNNVDDSRFHIFKAVMKYRAGEKWACSLGYLWEKATYSDYNKDGFTYVPSDGSAAGFYQGALLMGIIPQDYDVNQVYFKISHYY